MSNIRIDIEVTPDSADKPKVLYRITRDNAVPSRPWHG